MDGGLVFLFEDSIGLWSGVVVLDAMNIFQVLDMMFRYQTDPEGLHSVSRDQNCPRRLRLNGDGGERTEAERQGCRDGAGLRRG